MLKLHLRAFVIVAGWKPAIHIPATYGRESIERRMRSCRGCQGRYSISMINYY